MFKYSLLALIAVLVGLGIISSVVAEVTSPPSEIIQGTKEITCSKTGLVFNTLTSSEFLEIPVWVATDSATTDRYALFVNNETHTWTFVQFDPKNACILGAGSNFAFNVKPKETVAPAPSRPSAPRTPSRTPSRSPKKTDELS